MAQPAVAVTTHPMDSGALVYGPLAPKSTVDLPTGQLSVLFNLTNQEASAVTFTSLLVSFDPPDVAPVTIPVTLDPVQPGATKQWYFPTANFIILPDPAPEKVSFALTFETFSDPVIVDKVLATYNGAHYSFPARTKDLADGELWSGRSAKHGGAGGGTQMFAYDLLVVGFDTSKNTWTTAKEGTPGTSNSDYHSWGKPIYAMADGVVVQFLDGMAENTPPGFPSPTPDPVEGNHFYIQHGNDLALYAHLQPGSLPAALQVVDAEVKAGQLLGLCGNTGRSSEPHLHLQINQATQPWGGVGLPLTFTGLHVLDLGQVDKDVWPPDTDAPWVKVQGLALPPSVWCAIWPSPQIGTKPGRWKLSRVLAWAWLIVIGGLMFTPGGIDCIKCGPLFESILGIVSIVLGAAGLAFDRFRAPTAPSTGAVDARLQMDVDIGGS